MNHFYKMLNHHDLVKTLLIVLSIWSTPAAFAQCPIAQGDETSYGTGTWIGYVYTGINNFNSNNYQGFITENEMFDEVFCGNNCSFATNGCNVTTQNFSVRFRMRQTFTCGVYDITIGGDDGVRLSIDGGATFLISDYSFHPYRTTTQRVLLDGTYDLVLEYFEGGGDNRVSFDYVNTGLTEFEGIIGNDQDFCSAIAVDPAVINSLNDATFCGTTTSYQWQSSIDNVTFTDIPSATNNSYDPPAGLTQTTYYRRQATDGTTTLTSNVATVTISPPGGDEVTYGNGTWIGYVYDGVNNFVTADYKGFITEPETFNETFCGGNCTFSTSGCGVDATTFSTRFRMRKTFACGTYDLTIGGDDGVRLSIDGGTTYLISDYGNHGYRTRTARVNLDGSYDLVLEYFENGGANRVSFDYVFISDADGGEIVGDQNFCSSGGSTADPAIFSNLRDAFICGAIPSYQWQISTDNVLFSDIAGATNITYDAPGGVAQTTYYRRQATGGGKTATSNVITVVLETPQGDQVTYGNNSWIGYVYDGVNNFVNNYHGFITEPETFNETFCGGNCLQPVNGCDIQTQNYSVRFKMRKTFVRGDYLLTIGGDDGVRLSIDGGVTYLIDDYTNHGYRTSSHQLILDGTYDLVLEYFESVGGNRVSFDYALLTLLPVELMDFTAIPYDNERVDLKWRTDTETNNDFFTVEKSVNGMEWNEVTRINAAGTSLTPKSYFTNDFEPYAGTSYYRLKQTDFDGTFTYSKVVAVTMELRNNNAINIYPNPTRSTVTVVGNSEELNSIQVYDLLGKNISDRVYIGEIQGNTRQIDLLNLPQGLYIIVTDNYTKKVKKQG